MTAGQGKPTERTPAGVHRFALFTTGCTFLLLIAGALVTSNDAGLSVPTWPFAPGTILPRMVGGVKYEYSHRMIAGFVALLTVALAAWIWQREQRRWVRWLGVGALALVIVQAVLGGITVLFDLPSAISTAHAAAAQLFFSTLLALTLFTGSWWQSNLPLLEDGAPPSLRTISAVTVGVIFLQLVLGAAFRHNAFGVLPHVFGAGVVTAMVAWTVTIVYSRHGEVRPLRRAAKLLLWLLGIQLALGVAAYWSVLYQRTLPQPYPLPVFLTVAHVVNGALTLGASLLLSLVSFRLFSPLTDFATARASSSRPGQGHPASVRPS